MKVKELIEKLQKYDPNKEVTWLIGSLPAIGYYSLNEDMIIEVDDEVRLG